MWGRMSNGLGNNTKVFFYPLGCWRVQRGSFRSAQWEPIENCIANFYGQRRKHMADSLFLEDIGCAGDGDTGATEP